MAAALTAEQKAEAAAALIEMAAGISPAFVQEISQAVANDINQLPHRTCLTLVEWRAASRAIAVVNGVVNGWLADMAHDDQFLNAEAVQDAFTAASVDLLMRYLFAMEDEPSEEWATETIN